MSSIAKLKHSPKQQISVASIIGFFPPIVWLSLLWMILIIILAIFAPTLAPYDMEEMSLLNRLSPPGTPDFLLGTDNLGRDILTRTLYSIQISMIVATLGTLIGGVFGTLLGIIAASFGGWVDDAIMLLVDFQASLPFIVFALAMLAFLGNDLILFIAILGILGWESYARIARGLTLSVQKQEYITAAKALGVPPYQIYLRHVLPNIANAIIVNLTINFPGTILAEATLSFLGLGVQPPQSSLGLMLSIGRDYLSTAWWIAVIPGIVIFITTLAITTLGDWLRDYLDPRTRNT